MNIKEIAKLTGRGESTIRSWITSAESAGSSAIIAQASAKMAEASKRKKPADFNLEETIEIIKAGGNETLANLLSENAKNQKETALIASMPDKDYNLVSMLIKSQTEMIKSQTETNNLLIKVLTKMDAVQEPVNNVVKLPDPVVSMRKEAVRMVNEYVQKTGIGYQEVWGLIYSDFYYAFNINVKLRANNMNMSVIDYIETNGFLPELLAIVKKRCA